MIHVENWDSSINTKSQEDLVKYLDSSITWADRDKKKQPVFDQKLSVSACKGWMYAALLLNAKGVQRTTLRLYTRKNEGHINTRKLNKKQVKRLHGDLKHKPSDYVQTKMANWGDDFVEVKDDVQFMDVLRKPNPWMSGTEFCLLRLMYLQACGNAYIHPTVETARIDGQTRQRVKELAIMPSQYVTIKPAHPDSGELVEGFYYGSNALNQEFFPVDEVWHEKNFNMSDSYYGMGVLEAGWAAWQLERAQKEQDLARYSNMSRPDIAVIVKNSLTPQKKLTEMQNNWARLFRGTLRTGSPAFITGDTEIVPIPWQPTESGSIDQVLEEIASVAGTPVSLLKANDPNLASASVGYAFWSENTVAPLCKLDEEFLNTHLLPLYGLGEDAILVYDDPIPEDKEELREEWKTYGGTMITVNEGRSERGYPESDDPAADVLFAPKKTTLLEQLMQNLEVSKDNDTTDVGAARVAEGGKNV